MLVHEANAWSWLGRRDWQQNAFHVGGRPVVEPAAALFFQMIIFPAHGYSRHDVNVASNVSSGLVRASGKGDARGGSRQWTSLSLSLSSSSSSSSCCRSRSASDSCTPELLDNIDPLDASGPAFAVLSVCGWHSPSTHRLDRFQHRPMVHPATRHSVPHLQQSCRATNWQNERSSLSAFAIRPPPSNRCDTVVRAEQSGNGRRKGKKNTTRQSGKLRRSYSRKRRPSISPLLLVPTKPDLDNH